MGHEGEGGPDEPVVGARASHDGGRGCRREVFDYVFGKRGGEREDMLAGEIFYMCVCVCVIFLYHCLFHALQ